MRTGNKGEWSELYVLVRSLANRKLISASFDENTNEISQDDKIYFPILNIFREKEAKGEINFSLEDAEEVKILVNEVEVDSVKTDVLKQNADTLYDSIVKGDTSAFPIYAAEKMMDDMYLSSIKAPSTDKTDIKMKIRDIHTGYSPVCGFSIKSELGKSPTLLNASKATNFTYEVTGLSASQVEEINHIDTRNKIIDRISRICELGDMKYAFPANEMFFENLMLIDSRMDELLSYVLMIYYKDGIGKLADIVRVLEETNPMNYSRSDVFYRFKMKKLLCSIALGMVPSESWNGRDDANGGYIIVTKQGGVVAFHIYNRDNFEDYLLMNTRLERGSTSKHHYCQIFEHNGRYFINLNLQIRFL